MLLQQLNRSDPERVFVIGQNLSTGTLLGNTLVCWEGVIASSVSFGVGFMQPITSNRNLFAGVLDADVATGAFGLIQVYGHRSSIAANPATDVSISGAGLILGPLAASVSAQSHGASHQFGPIMLLGNAQSGTGYYHGFIRAM